MKPITLRGLPEPLARDIQERSKRTGASLNRTVIEMLAEQTAQKKHAIHHDLDHLAGILTAEEADELDEAIAEQRQIDPALWS